MIRIILILLFVIGSCLVLPAANPVVGTWNCVSTDERGNHVEFTLAIQDKNDGISAAVTLPDGNQIVGIEPRASGNSVTFKLQVNDTEVVEIKLTIDGKKLEGTFSGKDSGKGSIQGSRT